MMKRHGNWIAVALVATALCADRKVAAAPELREVPATSPSLASRLTTGLRRSVSTARIYQPQLETLSESPLALSRITPAASTAVYQPISPFQFRLPPPQL